MFFCIDYKGFGKSKSDDHDGFQDKYGITGFDEMDDAQKHVDNDDMQEYV